MIEENNEVVEEINDNEEQPIEETIEQTIDESKFDSADDPDVVKVDSFLLSFDIMSNFYAL